MHTRYLAALLATASTIVLGHSAPARAQQADQPAASSAAALEEVVVTARRKEEKAQTVPIAMTTFTPQALQVQDIRNTSDLQRDIPGLNFAGGGNSSQVGNFSWLRGATGVIGYFDQVPTNSLGGAAASNAGLNNPSLFFDVGTVQVLKGPQGTLFGLSNDAGAIVYDPKKPTNAFEGYVQASIGDYGRRTFEGVVNVPIVDDKLLVRIGALVNDQDGYIHVINQGISVGDQHYWVGRATILFRPIDEFQNELMVNYYSSHDNGSTFVLGDVNNAKPQALPFPVTDPRLQGLFGGGTGIRGILAQQKQLGWYTIQSLSTVPHEHQSQWNIVDTATWDINDEFTVKNIAGYQEYSTFSINDIDGLAAAVIPTQLGGNGIAGGGASGPSVQYTEELQLLGKVLDDKLSFTAGLFNELTSLRGPEGILFTRSLGGAVTGSSEVSTARSSAVYMQATYNLGDYLDGLSFTAGYRYSWDHIYARANGYNSTGGLLLTTSQSANFRSPSYTLSLDYQVTPETLIYVTDSRGYKTGGFNNGATGIITSFPVYGPEHLDNVETGIKTDFSLLNMKGRVNFSGFYGFYEAIQVQVAGNYPHSTGVSSIGTPFINVGNGAIYGYEGELTVLPVKDLEIGGAFEYNRGSFDSFSGPNPATGIGVVPISGIEYTYTPKWKFNLHGVYHLPIDKAFGDVSLTTVYSWTGDRVNGTVAPIDPVHNVDPAYDNLDMSLDWKDIWGKGGLDGRLYVTNLLENHWSNGSLAIWQLFGLIGYQVAPPRMYGFTMRYAFSE